MPFSASKVTTAAGKHQPLVYKCILIRTVVWCVLIYPAAAHRPCGHVCAQIEPLPWQQTTLKTIWQQPLPPSLSTHLPSKHCLITTSPTHYVDTPSPLWATACRVAMVSVLGHNNQQPVECWGSTLHPTCLVVWLCLAKAFIVHVL